MSESSSSPAVSPTIPSDERVSAIMTKGFEDIMVSTVAGLVIGGLAGVVLARGGGSGARKVIAGFGGGLGLGSSWTKVSMELEDLLREPK